MPIWLFDFKFYQGKNDDAAISSNVKCTGKIQMFDDCHLSGRLQRGHEGRFPKTLSFDIDNRVTSVKFFKWQSVSESVSKGEGRLGTDKNQVALHNFLPLIGDTNLHTCEI